MIGFQSWLLINVRVFYYFFLFTSFLEIGCVQQIFVTQFQFLWLCWLLCEDEKNLLLANQILLFLILSVFVNLFWEVDTNFTVNHVGNGAGGTPPGPPTLSFQLPLLSVYGLVRIVWQITNKKASLVKALILCDLFSGNSWSCFQLQRTCFGVNDMFQSFGDLDCLLCWNNNNIFFLITTDINRFKTHCRTRVLYWVSTLSICGFIWASF